ALSSTGTLTGTDPRGRRFVGGAVLAFRLPTNHPHRGACAADLARGRSRARPYACADCRAAGGRQGLPDRLLGSYLLSASTIASQLEASRSFPKVQLPSESIVLAVGARLDRESRPR